jgi:MFS transporter, PPP family, 3-phenylpropionic acid transporter
MKTQRWMSLHFFIFFLTWGIFLPYWTGWMIDVKEISVGEASFIMSAGLVARGLATLFVFPLLLRLWSSKALINFLGIATFLSMLLYIPANSTSSLFIITLLIHVFYPTLMPALDSAAGVLVQEGQLKHYGKSRSWGSIGFVVAGILLTFFTGALGDDVILWALLLGILVFMLLGQLQTPQTLQKKPEKTTENPFKMRDLFKIKGFKLVLLIVILLQAAHASYYNYGYIYLQEMDTPKFLIGIILNVAVISEIIFFSKADTAFGRLSIGSLLSLAALGSTLRWILIFAFPNVIVFTISQTLHAASFAMGHYAFMKYLTKNIPPLQVPNAQGIYSALALSWSTAVFTAFGGYLYEIEPRYAFIGMIVSSIPSLLLAMVYQKRETAVIKTSTQEV